MNALPVLEQFQELEAFFTQKPDAAESVRQRLLAQMEQTGERYVRARLVHGTRVQAVDREWLNGQVPGPYVEAPETDGLVTDLPGVALTTTHGDCLPVFAYDPIRGVIGLAHAGWKGTLHNIAGELLRTMEQAYGTAPKDVYTWVGPGIGVCHFEVQENVEQLFRQGGYGSYCFSGEKEGTRHIDLKAIVQYQLLQAGAGHIALSPHCTVCEEDRYYSYRRSGDTKRMLACIKKRV